MKKKLYLFLLILCLILPILMPQTISASPTTEMNIYGIYLDSPEKGDCVLLESKGHALLIDIGRYSHAPAILKQLKALGITHVDVCFSHLHPDHTGGSSTDCIAGLKFMINSGITVDNLYLPSKSYSLYSPRYQQKFQKIENYMIAYTNIHYLSVGDTLQIGDITGYVVGPVNDNNYSPSQYADYTGIITSEMYTRYENNTSLAMIFSCGNTKYFTAGDSYKDEAARLSSQYGSFLRSDIMKLCHHGTDSGNTKMLMNLVQPKYSFASNIKFTEKEDSGRWKIYNAVQRASKYGMCYAIGTEKKTIIYHVVNDEITLYKGLRVTPANKLKGWQHFYGSDGVNVDYNTYYLDKSGTPLTGVQKIGKHYYYFDDTGLMKYSGFTSSGNYKHWTTSTDGKQYYTLSSDRKYSYLAVGFKKINDTLYYFDADGYLYIDPSYAEEAADEDDIVFTKIGSNYYATDNTGALLFDEWLDQDGYEYFFKNDGKMVRNGLYTIDGYTYIFDTDGTLMVSEFSKYDFVSLKGKTYAVNSEGAIVKKQAVKINGKQYYFNSNGHLVKNQKIFWQGKKYKCNAKGVMKKIKK